MKQTLMCMILFALILVALILSGCGQSRVPGDMAAQARQGAVKAPRIPVMATRADELADDLTTEASVATPISTAVSFVLPAASEKLDIPTLASGSLGRFKLETNRAPEERPILYIHSPIVDQMTGQPVKADVYVFADAGGRPADKADAVQHGVDRIEFGFEQSMAGSWLVVVAPGFETWMQRIDFQIEYSRVYEGRVELVREGA